MPIALIVIGLLMIVTGARGTHKEFGKLLVGDFTGPGNFTYWLVALGIVGALGANETFRPFSRMFLVLIIVAMIIRNGGVFDKLNEALRAGPAQITPQQDTSKRAANDNRSSDYATAENIADEAVQWSGRVASFGANVGRMAAMLAFV